MKNSSAIAIALSALLFLSAAANAQNPASRNMERRGQSDQNDRYNRDNDDDQYSPGYDQHNQRNDQYNQRAQVMNNRRPRITVIFGSGPNRGDERYYDYRRQNDYRRYEANRRHEAFHRHEDYHRNNDYNNGCEAPRRYGY